MEAELWKSRKSWKRSPNTVYIFLWTRHRVLQIIFWNSRDIIQIVKKNWDEKYFFIVEKKKFKIFKISKISKISIFFWKLNILTFWKFFEFWDFWKFRKFLDFWKFRKFLRFRKFRKFLKSCWSKFFSTKQFSFFFWWPIPIPNFPKIPKITLRKSCDEFKDVKIRLFEILVYLYVAARIRSGENPTFWPLNFQIFWKISKKNLRKKNQKIFFDRKNIFSQTYTIARFLICLHYEPKDYVKPKILWIRDFCAVTTILWHLNSVALTGV